MISAYIPPHQRTAIAGLTHFLSESDYGLVIWPGKSRTFTLWSRRLLLGFSIGDYIVPVCKQHLYLGAPVLIPRAIRAERIHLIVQDLLDRLKICFTPLMWLVNNVSSISIPAARTIYSDFIFSIVDYLSHTLIQLSITSLEPHEKFQNKVMKII